MGNHFLIVERKRNGPIDLDSPIKYREIESDKVIILSHSFLLATTLEWWNCGKYQGQNKSIGSKIYQDVEAFRKKK